MAASSSAPCQYFNAHYDEEIPSTPGLVINGHEVNPTNPAPATIAIARPRTTAGPGTPISAQPTAPPPLKRKRIVQESIDFTAVRSDDGSNLIGGGGGGESSPKWAASTSVTDKEYWKNRKALCDACAADDGTKKLVRTLVFKANEYVRSVSFSAMKSTSLAPPTLLFNCFGAIVNAITQTPWDYYMGGEMMEGEEQPTMWVSGEFGEPDYKLSDKQKKFRTALLMRFKEEFETTIRDYCGVPVKLFFIGKYKVEKKEKK